MLDPSAFVIDEQETGLYRGKLVGNDGVTFLPASVLSTLTLTLYLINSDGTRTILNSRDAQNVLNANNVVVYEALQTAPDGSLYNLEWTIQVGDSTILDDALPNERHIALFEWTWPTGNQGKHEVVIVVRNLQQVS